MPMGDGKKKAREKEFKRIVARAAVIFKSDQLAPKSKVAYSLGVSSATMSKICKELGMTSGPRSVTKSDFKN